MMHISKSTVDLCPLINFFRILTFDKIYSFDKFCARAQDVQNKG